MTARAKKVVSLMEAQSNLMEKRRLLHQERENTLESIRTLLTQGEVNKARECAHTQFTPCTETWERVVRLFKDAVPHPACPKCGKERPVVVDSISLQVYVSELCEECMSMQPAAQWGQEDSTERDAKARGRLQESIESILSSCRVGQRFLHASLDDVEPKYKPLADAKEGVFLTGGKGVGKTHLAVALMRHHILNSPSAVIDGRINRGSFPVFVSVPDMLIEIKDTFGKSSKQTASEIITTYSDLPFLVMDDMGVEKVTDWTLETMYVIIDRRYRNKKKTIITSNIDLDAIAERTDDRMASRIAEMCECVLMKGPDRRVTTKTKGGKA